MLTKSSWKPCAGISPHYQSSPAKNTGGCGQTIPVSEGSNRHGNVLKLAGSKVHSSLSSAFRGTACPESRFRDFLCSSEAFFSLNHRLPEQGINLPALKKGFRETSWGKIAFSLDCCNDIFMPECTKSSWKLCVKPNIPHLVLQTVSCCWGAPRSASLYYEQAQVRTWDLFHPQVFILSRGLWIYSTLRQLGEGSGLVCIQMCTDTTLYLFIRIKSHPTDIPSANILTSVTCLQK